MRLRVEYTDGCLEFEGDADRLVAAFSAPPDLPADGLRERIISAFEAPIDYPPLRLVVVPGDRVVIPIDTSLPGASVVIAAMAEILGDVGVESIAAIVDVRDGGRPELDLPPGVERVIHDPSDREPLAYLASTTEGRRIYLNRRLADADCVIPVGRIGPDEALGVRGPWSVIDPGLSDSSRAPLSLLAPPGVATTRMEESLEVSWLLGSQFQVGGIPGDRGLLHLLCGLTTAVRDRGAALIDAAWGFTVDDRADLVIAGLGGPGRPASAADLIEGLRNALRVVRRGGRVALLSRVPIETVREAVRSPDLPRGDWEKALAWADIYLATSAEPDEVEEFGLIPLDRPEHAAKLAAMAPSYVTIGQVDRTGPASKSEVPPS